ncbi:MAG: exported protein of unknown function [Candidatus Thorarchaeota archaeon]|nr:MAG: exported protein of unknown function [Candidatus Thorarchaeota archaeon]
MFRASRITRIITVSLFFVLFMISMQSVAAVDTKADSPSLPSYIMRCYDGQGFADRPGLDSTFQSTLDAVRLMQDYTGPIPRSYWTAIDSIIERYVSMHSPFRGGFVDGDIYVDDPDFHTTALILETLSVLDRFDVINVSWVKRYLLSSFHQSLTIDRWLTEGDFDQKYWALRTAKAIDNVSLLGIRPLSLDSIITPDVNRADFPEDETYLRWGKFHFDDGIHGRVSEESLERKHRAIECFHLMINESRYIPTIMDLLVDTERLAQDIVSEVDVDAITDIKTSKVYRTLSRLGRTEFLFSDESIAHQVCATSRNIVLKRQVCIDSLDLEDVSLSQLTALQTIHQTIEVIRETLLCK